MAVQHQTLRTIALHRYRQLYAHSCPCPIASVFGDLFWKLRTKRLSWESRTNLRRMAPTFFHGFFSLWFEKIFGGGGMWYFAYITVGWIAKKFSILLIYISIVAGEVNDTPDWVRRESFSRRDLKRPSHLQFLTEGTPGYERLWHVCSWVRFSLFTSRICVIHYIKAVVAVFVVRKWQVRHSSYEIDCFCLRRSKAIVTKFIIWRLKVVTTVYLFEVGRDGIHHSKAAIAVFTLQRR